MRGKLADESGDDYSPYFAKITELLVRVILKSKLGLDFRESFLSLWMASMKDVEQKVIQKAFAKNISLL